MKKVLIELSDRTYKELDYVRRNEPNSLNYFESIVASGKVLSDMTNREILMMIFNDETLLDNIGFCYGEDWLNAKYEQKEVEE